MYALCAIGRLPWLPVVLITAREVWMSVYRSRASSQGPLDPGAADREAQDLRRRTSRSHGACSRRPPTCIGLQLVTIWLAAALTVYTGYEYWRDGRRATVAQRVRVEVVAVGSELLLGQIADTNSQWLGEQLAAAGRREPLPPARRRQPRADGARAANRAREVRRGDRVRGPRPDAGRHHPRGDRRGDGRRPRARRGDRGTHRGDVPARVAARCPTTTVARPTCRAARR